MGAYDPPPASMAVNVDGDRFYASVQVLAQYLRLALDADRSLEVGHLGCPAGHAWGAEGVSRSVFAQRAACAGGGGASLSYAGVRRPPLAPTAPCACASPPKTPTTTRITLRRYAADARNDAVPGGVVTEGHGRGETHALRRVACAPCRAAVLRRGHGAQHGHLLRHGAWRCGPCGRGA